MMIAALHLRIGDQVISCPPSDEANFDVIYNGVTLALPDAPLTVRDVQRRHPPVGEEENRRYVQLSDRFRCWDNTRLINVTQRNGS